MDIKFSEPSVPSSGTAAVAVFEERKLAPTATKIDKATDGALSRAMAASRFVGRKGQRLDVIGPPGGTLERVVLVGLGKAKDLTERRLEGIGGGLVAHLNGAGVKRCVVALDEFGGSARGVPGAASLAFGALLRSYRFDKYRTKEKPEDKPSLKELSQSRSRKPDRPGPPSRPSARSQKVSS